MNKIIKKYKIDQTTWTHKGFHGVLHTFFPVGQQAFPMRKFFGDSCGVTAFFVQNNYVHWYWNDQDLTRLRETLFKRLQKNPRYLAQLKNDWKKKLCQFDKIITKVQHTNFAVLSDEQLAKMYDDFYFAYLAEFTYFMTLGDAVSMHADRYLVPEFKKILGNDFDKVFPQLMATQYRSFIEEEAYARQKLIAFVRCGKAIPHRLLKQHAEKYFYIYNNYAKGEYLTPADFAKLIQEDLKKEKTLSETPQGDSKQNWKTRGRLIRKYYLSSYQQILLGVMDEFFGIQDERKKYVLISNYYQFQFLREVERRSGFPFSLLCYSVYPEFRMLLARKLDKKVLAERRKMCFCVQTAKGYKIITGSPAKKLLDFFMTREDKKGAIKGMVAAPGKIQGYVKIILKIHDLVNMEDGDVLVASMTRPEMMSAMKRASAIVTDEGGITCHAAIVSRELGIPCIIGTKIATQVLKDGDLVEVDAEKGIVRKI